MQFIRNVFRSFFSLDSYGDTEHDYHFPTTLEGFGYHFNENGLLRQTNSDQPFQYKVKEDDRQYNQAHYEALGACIGHHIEELLMTKYNLQQLQVPLKEPNDPEDKARSHVYISQDALTSTDTLLVLLQGSGTIRPGQWSRRVIMNESLEAGSMFPYIERAQRNGWNVMILNPNYNEIAYEDGDGQDFGGEGGLSFSKSPGSMTIEGKGCHFCASATAPYLISVYRVRNSRTSLPVCVGSFDKVGTNAIWNHCMAQAITTTSGNRDCKAKHIIIVAFSYGGHAISVLATQNALEFTQRVSALALVDSVHSKSNIKGRPVIELFNDHVRQWVASKEKLDTEMPYHTKDAGCPCVSSGHTEHENAPGAAKDSIMQYLENEISK